MSLPFAYSRWKINTKLMAIISGLLVVALGVMIALATFYFLRDTESRIKAKNQQLCKLLAGSVEQELTAVLADVNLSSELLAPATVRPDGEAAKFLDQILKNEPRLMVIAITEDGAGAANPPKITRVNPFMPAGSGLAPEILARVEAGLTTVKERARGGEVVVANISDIAQVPLMVVAVPFHRGPDGATLSVAYGLYRLESIQQLFSKAAAGDIVELLMVDGQGEVVAHPDSQVVLARGNLAAMPIVAAMLKSPVGNGQKSYVDDRGRHLATFWKLALGGLGVVASVPEDLAYREVRSIQRNNIYLAVIVLGVAILLTFFFARTLAIPLGRLAKATGEITSGNYKVRVQIKSEDEVGILGGSFNSMAQGLEDKERLRETLGKFANKEVAEKAMRGELTLGGERRDVTILFSDIRSFTAISETLQPEEVVEFLNRYLTAMEKCVSDSKGTVDKYIGDAVMAIWGAPTSYGNDAQNAIDGALAMRASLLEFNKDRGGDRKPVIKIGVGLNTGPVLAGQIGSDNHIAYTVIGDAVNLASRIEALNKPFGTDILISEQTRALLPETYRVEPMQKIKVKGKSEPQQIYAVLGRVDDPATPADAAALRRILGTEMKAGASGDEEEVKYELIPEGPKKDEGKAG